MNVRPKAVVIGVSTGGPTALGTMLPALPADFALPILIVQHMPPLFTRLLAERINATCKLPAEEATQDSPVVPGKILIAPGDFHMKLASNGRGRIRAAPRSMLCFPPLRRYMAGRSSP
jgi:two-component system chemotaxis response regulator CheB